MTGIFLFIFAAFLTALSHVLIKISINKYKNIFLSRKLLIACTLLISVTLITITAYKYIGLKYGIVLSSSSYIFIILLSKFILKEKISLKAFFGSALITMGIIIFSINQQSFNLNCKKYNRFS